MNHELNKHEYYSMHARHKSLWLWLAETGKDKVEWPQWHLLRKPDSLCFACQSTVLLRKFVPTPYSGENFESRRNCNLCPIDAFRNIRGNSDNRCVTQDTVFSRWQKEVNRRIRYLSTSAYHAQVNYDAHSGLLKIKQYSLELAYTNWTYLEANY